MALNLYWVADETTPQMTPDALRVQVEQSGFPVRMQKISDDEYELVMDHVMLVLIVEQGFVTAIEGQSTIVNDRRADKLFDLLESMGWIAAED